MATPMSAAFSAGASLTPSPVMATTWPRALQRLDDAHLVLGRHAGEHARCARPASASAASSSASSSAPLMHLAARRPSSRAMAAAVALWSPVIILTSMPACWQTAMASFASGRGGSMMPTSAEEGPGRRPRPSDRRPGRSRAPGWSAAATASTRSASLGHARRSRPRTRRVPPRRAALARRRRPAAGAGQQHVGRALDEHLAPRRRRGGRWP